MLSSLSSDIDPAAFVVYYPIVDGSSTDTGLLSEKEKAQDVKDLKLWLTDGAKYSVYDFSIESISEKKKSTFNVSCVFILENRCHMKRLYSQIISTSTYHFIVYTPNDLSLTVQAACRALVPKWQA